jgi:uncharacterized protein YdaU (DUF1376 family)
VSFAYLPLFTGDYLRDTQHLSMSEHGAFLKLLMFCWDQKGPAPLDERKLCGIVNARSGDEVEALRRVLGEFFVRMEDGYYNKRMQREVERSEVLSRSRSDAGRKGYEAKAKQLPSKSQAIAKQEHLTPSPSPSLSSTQDQTKKTKSTLGVAELVSMGVDRQHAEDWLRARKEKRLPLTQTALDDVNAEATKAGLTLPQAIAKAAAKGWGGFKASWLLEDAARTTKTPPVGRQAALEERNRQAAQDWLRMKEAQDAAATS